MDSYHPMDQDTFLVNIQDIKEQIDKCVSDAFQKLSKKLEDRFAEDMKLNEELTRFGN